MLNEREECGRHSLAVKLKQKIPIFRSIAGFFLRFSHTISIIKFDYLSYLSIQYI